MTQITVQSFKMNPSGKSGVIKSADGQDYFYKAPQHHHLADGMTFEVAVQESSYNGKINKWIDGKWPPFNGGQRPAAPAPASPAPVPQPQTARVLDGKDVQITTIALMKSFIETGKFGLTDLPQLEAACIPAAKRICGAAQ